MNTLGYYLIILCIIVILLIIIFIVVRNNIKSPPNIDPFTLGHQNDPNFNWNPATLINPGQNCQLYTFNTQPINNPSVINNMQFDNSLLSTSGCIDQDQLYLIPSTRLCGVKNSNIPTCIGYDGKIYNSGQTEFFYNYCTNPYCNNSIIGSIAINFNYLQNTANGNIYNAQCLTLDSNKNVNVSTCDPSNNLQMFRISRADAPVTNDTTNTTIGLANANAGQYMQILDRVSGKCILPVSNEPNSILSLQSCNNSLSGYNWLLVPPIFYDDGNITTVTPQQLVYVENIYPITTKNIADIIITQNPKSLVLNNGNAMLELFATDIFQTNPVNGTFYNSQILDKRIYPILSGNYTDVIPILPNPIQSNTNNQFRSTNINYGFYQWQPISN